MPLKEERNLYIRRLGDAWILIGVSGTTPEDQMQSTATVEVLY